MIMIMIMIIITTTIIILITAPVFMRSDINRNQGLRHSEPALIHCRECCVSAGIQMRQSAGIHALRH
jgi:cbb3-type cytochrome oxidase cytochrome c subunit